jgi:hypothetical protein
MEIEPPTPLTPAVLATLPENHVESEVLFEIMQDIGTEGMISWLIWTDLCLLYINCTFA